MEHMKEKGLVERKVEVPAHTLILAQPYPTSRKRTLLCEREYWILIVQIRQSAHYLCGIMYHKTTWRHTNAHTTFVFTDICCLEAMIYAHYLFGGKELGCSYRLNDQCDIYKHIEWWFDNEF